jgi:AcrR family transcriptional regulator
MARKAPATTRNDLLEAAESCFAAHGLEATKVEEITAQVGIAKGAFYSYFESKEECWRQLVEQFLVKLRGAVDMHETAVSETRAVLSERLEIWLEHDLRLFEFCWDNRTMLNILMNGSGGAAYSHLLDEFARHCEKNIEALVHELISEHVYRDDLDPGLVACMYGGAYDRLVRLLISAPSRPNLLENVRKAQRLFLFGLLTDRAKDQLVKTEASPLKIRATRSSR